MFRQLFDPESSTLTYLIADDVSHEAVIVDPVIGQLERDLKLIREHGLTLKYTLETHVHADHVTGATALKQATGAQTVVSRGCVADGYDRLLDDGDVILFGREELTAIATPGHTAGSLSYLWRDRILTGDTLLIGGCGRTDFQNGSADQLWESITGRLFALDPQTLVYPGHDYKGRRVSSIGEEREHNPRLAGKSREDFVTLMENLGLPMPKHIHEAVPANLVAGSGRAEAAPAAAVTALSVSARQFSALAREGSVLVDVRTPAEFESMRVPGSINVPLDRLDTEALKRQYAGKTIYCICQTGTRSQLAAARLRAAGVEHVVHVDGGTNAWTAAGLETERGERKVIALDRQMRIAAGSLVLLGVAAGALLHPAFYVLSAFIGAGLVYAGATDSCGMSMVLARMPWNQARAPGGT
jgi:sulfur dioxygenase